MLKSHSPRSLRLSLWSFGLLVPWVVFYRLLLRWLTGPALQLGEFGPLLLFVIPAVAIVLGWTSALSGMCVVEQRTVAWLWVLPTFLYVAGLSWGFAVDVARFWHLFREAGVAFSDLVAKQSILSAAAVGVLVAVLVPKSWKKWSDGFVQRHQTLLWWTVGILFALIPLVVFWNL